MLLGLAQSDVAGNKFQTDGTATENEEL